MARPSCDDISGAIIAHFEKVSAAVIQVMRRGTVFIQSGDASVTHRAQQNDDLVEACIGDTRRKFKHNPTISACVQALFKVDAHYMFRITGDETVKCRNMSQYRADAEILQKAWTNKARADAAREVRKQKVIVPIEGEAESSSDEDAESDTTESDDAESTSTSSSDSESSSESWWGEMVSVEPLAITPSDMVLAETLGVKPTEVKPIDGNGLVESLGLEPICDIASVTDLNCGAPSTCGAPFSPRADTTEDPLRWYSFSNQMFF